jgi:D-alanine-D-alanine ligase
VACYQAARREVAEVSHLSRARLSLARARRCSGPLACDLRLTPENKLYFIEANPNPILSGDEDFALSAAKAGLPYPDLIERIVRLGIRAIRD